MTDQRTTNAVVHAAFWRDLARFEAALTAFPAGSRPRADELGRAWEALGEELQRHHGCEEQYFAPALQQTDATAAPPGAATARTTAPASATEDR